MKKFDLINNISGWFVFLVSAIVYLLTIEPTTSFWDCGEFIASAYKLEVGHPPGAPFWMIAARFFSLFSFGDPSRVAAMVNAMSAIVSAFTIMFLFWSVTHIAKRIIISDNENSTTAHFIGVLGTGFLAAFVYTFSDTFWFSAVEGEVYAMSSLFTAIVFWAILKWENVADEPYSNRWLILIAYLMGLSIGVHLLNLLAIPAIVFIYYFKKFKITKKGIALASVASIFILASIQYGIIPGVITVASKFELFFVNILGMNYNSGVLVYALLLISSIVLGLKYTAKNGKAELSTLFTSLAAILLGIPFLSSSIFITLLLLVLIVGGIYFAAQKSSYVLNTILLVFTVILLGYSSFTMIVIRSFANPPMDENNPENVFSLLSYLNREQYGNAPLVYGEYFNSPLKYQENGKAYKNGAPVYVQKNGKYEIVDYKAIYEYEDGFETFFPRMYSRQDNHVSGYKSWSQHKGIPITYTDSYEETKTISKPTFIENLRYFFSYQVNHMYLRYFLWNFSGRQNTLQGHGDYSRGNWTTGIKFLDEARLGPQENLPSRQQNDRGNNKYYMLPLLFGVIGLLMLLQESPRYFVVLLLFFLFTGLAIVLYTNQPPYQPRERDYAYAGSFYAFAMFIGLGLIPFIKAVLNTKFRTPLVIILTIISLGIPALMAQQNWDDHNRSGRFTARDFAINYLNSCEPNAIIFTYGDNDTFPLWYVQEVEGIRTDVRVVNLSLLSTDWYITQMKQKAYLSDPVPFSLNENQYELGKLDYVYILDRMDGYQDLEKIMEFVVSDDPRTKQIANYSEAIEHFPTRKFRVPVDSAKVVENGTVPIEKADKIVPELLWAIEDGKRALTKSEIMILDLLATNNWERPVYFAASIGDENYLNLQEYFRLEGFAYRLVPYKTPIKGSNIGDIDTESLYDKLMNKFVWGRMNADDVYFDEQNIRTSSLMSTRDVFARLANKLAEENKKDSAIAVVDKAMELMPFNRLPYDMAVAELVKAYYKAGAVEKAVNLSKNCAEICEHDLNFYYALTLPYKASVETEISMAMYLFNSLTDMAFEYDATEHYAALKEKFDILFLQYQSTQ